MKFRFTVQRTRESISSTQGEWTFIGQSESMFSLEPPRLHKGRENVPGLTCVPAGLYDLHKHLWTHANRWVLELEGVPGRTAILIHPMNRPSDTMGCIGAGFDEGDDFILHSRDAVDEITKVGFSAIDSGDGAEILILNIPVAQSRVAGS